METYDFCLAWNWPHDCDFVGMLESACQRQQISLLQVTPADASEVMLALETDQIWFNAFFDRGSDEEKCLHPLAEWAYRRDVEYINRFWLAQRTWDKTTMHHQFTRSGLDAPYTVALPSYQQSPELPPMDLSPFANGLAIKPAHGGGGEGVILGKLSWEQILWARQQNPRDQYLLQARVVPAQLEGRPAWFRMIYCLGRIFACWWDPTTHLYTELSQAEINRFRLAALLDITERIAQLSILELFSTEIAYTSSGRFQVVDYVNDPIDLRPQSTVAQGVPDWILKAIASELAARVAVNTTKGIMNARQA